MRGRTRSVEGSLKAVSETQSSATAGRGAYQYVAQRSKTRKSLLNMLVEDHLSQTISLHRSFLT